MDVIYQALVKERGDAVAAARDVSNRVRADLQRDIAGIATTNGGPWCGTARSDAAMVDEERARSRGRTGTPEGSEF